MKTKVQTINDIKNLFVEMLLNKTDKITKVSDNSVLSGLAYGVAKVFQKGMKDSAIVESELFPEYAFGESLDIIASRQGLSERHLASGSSVIVKLVGEYGTFYDAEQNICLTSGGFRFKLSKNITIGYEGYAYVIANSLQTGESVQIAPRSIVKILNPPIGHKYITNESMSVGGSSIEPDKLFRTRITEGFNVLSTDTLSRLQQVFITLNSNILDLKKLGKTSQGHVILGIITRNGIALMESELNSLIEESKRFLSITDIKPYHNELTGLVLQNVNYIYIDVDFYVDLNTNVDIQQFALNVQTEFLNYFDWRFWDEDKKVEWDDLFAIVKAQPEVKYVPDNSFNPRSDIVVGRTSVPRLRQFIIRSLKGVVLFTNEDVLNQSPNPNAIYYESHLSENYINTVLSNI